MSTLDPHGMVGAYKVNRPLNDSEKRHRFDVNKPCSQKPHYELSLIKLNSTFVECVDKWFSMRGFVAMGGAAIAAVMAAAIPLGIKLLFTDEVFDIFDFLFALVVIGNIALLIASIHMLTRDAFTYTHYPIRFNRKNRQVYVFRRDGTVLKAGWKDICWTISEYGTGVKEGCVMGHILGDDKKTIKESFALSLVTATDTVGVQDLRDHFEFFRRYMEDGPAQVLDAIKPMPLIMLPGIYKTRETWAFGWERLTLNLNGWPLVQLLSQVFIIPESLFRWFVMRTSKIPQWPQWVEDECPIDPDDLWIRDERHAAK
jgi:hypothetical protein